MTAGSALEFCQAFEKGEIQERNQGSPFATLDIGISNLTAS
jgi:hypothetical protein